MYKRNITVSIVCLVYNHEPYLRQCLDGFVMQQTSFPIEVVIHDDASTDGSIKIIHEYYNKYPNIFHPIIETENQWSIDNSLIIHKIFKKIKDAKYVAMCEGDDYWTDPHKLQKQVDFMESHPDYAICYHHVKILNSLTNEFECDNEFYNGIPDDFSIKELSIRNCIHTNSVLYRNRIKAWEKVLRLGTTIVKDYPNHMFHAESGLIKRLPDIMGVYRKGNGVWSGNKDYLHNDIEWLICISKISALIDDNETKKIIEQQINERKIDTIQLAELPMTQLHSLMSSNDFRIGQMITKRFPLISKMIIKFGDHRRR